MGTKEGSRKFPTPWGVVLDFLKPSKSKTAKDIAGMPTAPALAVGRPGKTVSRKTLNRVIGNLGEQAAAKELQRQNYRILGRNYRCDAGEIDVIAEHRGHVVFVEVKTRSPRALASPEDAVDAEKRQRIRSAAAHYLSAYRQASPRRFDIVSVLLDDLDCPVSIAVNAQAFE